MLSAPRPPPASLLAGVHPRFLLLHPGMFVVQVAARLGLLPSPCLLARFLRSRRHWHDVCNISYSNMVGFRAPNYYNNPPIRKVSPLDARELGIGTAGGCRR